MTPKNSFFQYHVLGIRYSLAVLGCTCDYAFYSKKKKKKRKGKGKKERREKEKKRKFKKKKRKTKDRKKQRVGSKSRRTQGVLGLAAASLPTGPLWSPWLARAPSGRPASCGPCGPVSTLCTTPGPQGKLRPFSFQSPLSSSELS